MRFAVVVFPGTNCDQETYHVITNVLGEQADLVWHEETDLSSYDCIVLPGGFSYGDYLRAGAIARFSPIMKAVERAARQDRLVWGICNGFQVLLEAGLLPGAMLRNAGISFRCHWVHLRVETADCPFTSGLTVGAVLRLPIAHGEGNYYAPPDVVKRLLQKEQVVLRYCTRDGLVTQEANPNGSVYNIAGICNEGKNVFGMMPHPERAAESILGGADGLRLFESVVHSWSRVSPRAGESPPLGVTT